MGPPSFPVPPDERERLQDVRSLGLDGEPEIPELGRIPMLAAEVCDSPWAGVSVVQEDEHRFLAVQGPFSSPIPREQAPCSHAITNPEDVFVLENLARDEALGQTPVVEEVGVRFYAGAPITSERGHGLGTVCVLDEEPRTLEQGPREALAALSHVVGLQLRLRRRTEELQRANEELDQFTTFVSHELTDPINQVVGSLELLRMDLDDVEEETREFLDEALGGVDRMDRMIKDLLRYARASGRELEKDTVDVRAVVDDVVSSLESRSGSLGVELEIGPLPVLEADGDLLRRVLHNLVHNAVEHGGDPGRVRIRSDETEHAPRIWVEDDGRGIPPREQEHLFELFAKGPESEGHSSGVGLALCERIVERHGGGIGVESEPGQGARFWFTLPH